LGYAPIPGTGQGPAGLPRENALNRDRCYLRRYQKLSGSSWQGGATPPGRGGAHRGEGTRRRRLRCITPIGRGRPGLYRLKRPPQVPLSRHPLPASGGAAAASCLRIL